MQMIRKKMLLLLTVAAVASLAPIGQLADAAGRQYYSGWRYHTTRRYYYRSYYYKPRPTYTSYRSHYCIHYPAKPRYVYYYNRYNGHYWGRFDTQGKEGAQYSLLAQKDRKADLEDIPESAFPKPAQMPVIPESDEGETARIEPPSLDDLPKIPG